MKQLQQTESEVSDKPAGQTDNRRLQSPEGSARAAEAEGGSPEPREPLLGAGLLLKQHNSKPLYKELMWRGGIEEERGVIKHGYSPRGGAGAFLAGRTLC